MNWKLSRTPRQFLNIVAALVGIGLLIALGFSLNTLFAFRSQQPLQIASQRGESSVQESLFTPTPPASQPEAETLSPTPTIVTSPDDPTEGWKVYTDAEVGLSLKYPPTWTLKPGKYVDPSKDFYEIRFDQSYAPTYRGITVSVDKKPEEQETRAFIQQQATHMTGTDTKLHLTMRDISVGGVPAIKVSGMPGIGNIAVFVERGSWVHRFALEEGGHGVPVEPQNEDIFYQMLGTIKFK